MEKMIMFEGYIEDLPVKVNEWLSKNSKVQILDRQVTMVSGNLIVFAVTIFYREAKP